MDLALEATDLARIKQEAWELVNKARKAVGLQPALFFPRSRRNDESHCVIASTIPLNTDRAGRKLVAEAWGTKVYLESEVPPSDEDYYVSYQGDWIKLPAVVTQFRNLFNGGHYPELEAE